jgi:hypothetical protein
VSTRSDENAPAATEAGEGQALVERSVTRTARGQGERKQRGRGHDQRQDGHEQGDVAVNAGRSRAAM